MLALVTSWLTPASLFVFLNLMIGTIALASRFGSRNHPQLARAPSFLERVKSINFSTHKYTTEPENTSHVWDNPPHVERVPSFLKRLKSFSFITADGSESQAQLAREPDSVSYPGHSGSEPTVLERVTPVELSPLRNSESEAEPASDPWSDAGRESSIREEYPASRSKQEHREAPEKIAKMAKSASEKAVAVEASEQEREEDVEKRRPSTTRMERTASIGDDAVDAKADDFINRFKQQLKLQRLDSLLRYREMIQGKPKT